MYKIIAALLISTQALAVQEGDSLPKHQGQTAIVNYWATWCEACKVELKEMEKLFLDAKGVTYSFVALDKDPAKATAYFRETHPALVPYLSFDPEFKEADSLKLESFPTTLVVSKTGKIIRVQSGFKEGAGSTEAILKAALGDK